MDWTDRHCRAFHRTLTRRARLYTEMVTADAILNGDRDYLLGFDPIEHPVAVQLGGADPAKLAEVARISADFGYDEINLNVGCPSDRVQSGLFGACLMKQPDLVARCVRAMGDAVELPVTVKCRIGVDDQCAEDVLPGFLRHMIGAGCETVIVHARKAWLEGLSPKENREIPPLDYPLVYRMKDQFPDLTIVINGGIDTLEQARAHLDYVDGVMLGRAAYKTPALLAAGDSVFFDEEGPCATLEEAVEAYKVYVSARLAEGVPLGAIARHMLGLFAGRPGARAWRQILTVDARAPGANVDVIDKALAQVARQPALAALR